MKCFRWASTSPTPQLTLLIDGFKETEGRVKTLPASHQSQDERITSLTRAGVEGAPDAPTRQWRRLRISSKLKEKVDMKLMIHSQHVRFREGFFRSIIFISLKCYFGCLQYVTYFSLVNTEAKTLFCDLSVIA